MTHPSSGQFVIFFLQRQAQTQKGPSPSHQNQHHCLVSEVMGTAQPSIITLVPPHHTFIRMVLVIIPFIRIIMTKCIV